MNVLKKLFGEGPTEEERAAARAELEQKKADFREARQHLGEEFRETMTEGRQNVRESWRRGWNKNEG